MTISGYHIVDLTYRVSEAMPVPPGDPAVAVRGADGTGHVLLSTSHVVAMSTRTGTHAELLGPHAAANGMADAPRERLISRVVVINVEERALSNPGYLFSADALAAWEEQHGTIAEGSVVLLYTGWAQHWGDGKYYQGDVAHLRFPGYSQEVLDVLVRERKVGAIGADTPGIGGAADGGPFSTVPPDRDVLLLENLRNVDRLPATGALLFLGILPLHRENVAPARVLALVPEPREEE